MNTTRLAEIRKLLPANEITRNMTITSVIIALEARMQWKAADDLMPFRMKRNEEDGEEFFEDLVTQIADEEELLRVEREFNAL